MVRKRDAGARDSNTGPWPLQEAKARFSELVRRVRSEGPQHVTVHGRDEVVILTIEDYRRLNETRSGELLVDAMQAVSGYDFDFAESRDAMPVRSVDL